MNVNWWILQKHNWLITSEPTTYPSLEVYQFLLKISFPIEKWMEFCFRNRLLLSLVIMSTLCQNVFSDIFRLIELCVFRLEVWRRRRALGRGGESFRHQESTLCGDVLLITAFVSYLGYFTKRYRLELMDNCWRPYLSQLKVCPWDFKMFKINRMRDHVFD